MLSGTQNETSSMEAGLKTDEVPAIIQLVSRILCWNRVGNPDGLDSSGQPNWTWYRSEAQRFVATHGKEIEELLGASVSQ